MGTLVSCCIEDQELNCPTSDRETQRATDRAPLLEADFKDFDPKPGIRSRENSFSDSFLQESPNAFEDYGHITRNETTTDLGMRKIPIEFSKLYRIGNLLGLGTTSKVFRIFFRKRKNEVDKLACKIIDKRKLTMGMSPDDVDFLLGQLRKEVDVLKQVSHPCIVTFHDFMETKDRLFIITEYLVSAYFTYHVMLSQLSFYSLTLL